MGEPTVGRDGGEVERYKPLTANVSKNDKKSGEKTKKGYTESQWFKAAFLSEKAGKFGAREQIRAQVQGDSVTIQVVRQGAFRRFFNSLNSFASKEKVVAQVKLKREVAEPLLGEGKRGQNDAGKVNVENAKNHIRACQDKQSHLSKELDGLIQSFEGNSKDNFNAFDREKYAHIKSQLKDLKVALSKVDALDKITEFHHQIKKLSAEVNEFKELKNHPPNLKKKTAASPTEAPKPRKG